MWKKFSLESLQLKKFTLSQQIVILITLVVCIALLPASMFTTYKVSKVIYDRVSINAVSINNILCTSQKPFMNVFYERLVEFLDVLLCFN